jgi:hypothetical protein
MGTPVLRPSVSARSYGHADSEVDSNKRRLVGQRVTGCMQLEEFQSQSRLIHLVRSASKQPRVTIELPIHPMSQPALGNATVGSEQAAGEPSARPYRLSPCHAPGSCRGQMRAASGWCWQSRAAG